MYRFIGASLVILGSFGMGYQKNALEKRQLYMLLEIRRFFLEMINEITYAKEPIPSACSNITGKMAEPIRKILEEINETYAKNQGQSYQLIWQSILQKKIEKRDMYQKILQVLSDFSHTFGCNNMSLQLQSMEQYSRKIDSMIREQQAELKNRGRVILCLYGMGGIFVAILLL